MPYFRVDDDFPQHPKVLAIPRRHRAAAVGLWTLAGSWCSRNLTDGRLAKHMVEELGSSKKYADLLVSTGLWIEDGEAYFFHQFVPWQGASREEVLAKREAEAERKRRWREEKAAKRAAQDDPVPPVSQRDNPGTDTGTPPSVPPDVQRPSARSPLLPSPTLPSPPHPDVPYGDIEDESPSGGDVQKADARPSNAPLPHEPPLCRRHIGWDRDSVPACAACGRLREQWETARLDAHRPPPRPPWCGDCDEHTRLLEIDDPAFDDEHRTVVTRCPRCHPAALELAGAHR